MPQTQSMGTFPLYMNLGLNSQGAPTQGYNPLNAQLRAPHLTTGAYGAGYNPAPLASYQAMSYMQPPAPEQFPGAMTAPTNPWSFNEHLGTVLHRFGTCQPCSNFTTHLMEAFSMNDQQYHAAVAEW